MQSILKSIFITGFPFVAIIVAIISGQHLLETGFSYQHFGNLIVALSVVVFFAGLFIFPRARTSKNLSIFSAITILGIIFNIVGQVKTAELVNNWFALLLGFGWILYLTWYSSFKNRNKNILKVGNTLANFELENSSKNKVSSTSFLGNPAIYLFFRGNWCPLCMAQIKEIAKQYKALEVRNVSMVFISPQAHKFSENLAKKYDLGFHFLTDTKSKVAKQLDIFAKNGLPAGFQILGYNSDTVLPTVVITDANGKIVFADLTDNYRLRPEPATFLKVIDAM